MNHEQMMQQVLSRFETIRLNKKQFLLASFIVDISINQSIKQVYFMRTRKVPTGKTNKKKTT